MQKQHRIGRRKALRTALLALLCAVLALSLALPALAELDIEGLDTVDPEVLGPKGDGLELALPDATLLSDVPAVTQAAMSGNAAANLPEYKSYRFSNSGFIYSDELLQQDARNQSTDLAKASALLSELAYSKSSVEGALEQMGFSCYDYGSYHKTDELTVWDNDHVAFTVGKKVVGSTTLYCVPIRGTPNTAEWHSNFRLGQPTSNDGFHEGFYKAAQDVLTALRAAFGDDTGTRSIWLMGHSRGAAVANLVAGLLTEEGRYAGADRIYCYTYACPSVGVSTRVKAYGNIVNYNNTGDVIPLLPLQSWGYARFGETKTVNLRDCPNFLRHYNQEVTDYLGANGSGNWLNLLGRFAPTADVYESKHVLLEFFAYALGGRNDIPFTDFMAYILSKYHRDLTPLALGSKLDSSSTLSIIASTLRHNISDENGMLDDLGDYYREYNAADSDHKASVFSTFNWLFSRIGELLGMSINSSSDVSSAEKQLLFWIGEQEDMIVSIDSLIDLFVDSDYKVLTSIGHGHDKRAYVLWINSWYCGYHSWEGTGITNPASVAECRLDECTTIGESAFEDCAQLARLTLYPNLRFVGERAFYSCTALTQLTLPKATVGMGSWAFDNCSGLTSVTLPIELSAVDQFYGCSNVASIHYTVQGDGAMPDRDYLDIRLERSAGNALKTIQLDEGVTHIASYAFFYNNIQTLVGGKLPSTLKSIGEYAFHDNKNLSIDGLPGKLERLDDFGLAGTGLKNIRIPETLTALGRFSCSDCDALTSVEIPKWVTTMGEGALSFCDGLTSVTLPIELSAEDQFAYCDSVASIHYTVQGNGAMPERTSSISQCLERSAGTTLKTVQFDEGVTHIAGYAFSHNPTLAMEAGALPPTLESIGEYAFANTEKIRALDLPASLKSLGDYAFSGSGLKRVTFLGNPPELPDNAFNGVTATARYSRKKASWNSNLLKNYGGMLRWCAIEDNQAYRMTLPGATREVEPEAFEGCAAEIIEIPQGTTRIGARAFANSTWLLEVHIPASVKSISEDAFAGCSPRIIAPKGSFAQEFAKKQGLDYTEAK